MGTDRVSPVWQSFGNQVRHAREQAGCSVSELATMTSASASLVYKIESGTRAAKRDVAEAIDAALGQDGALVVAWSNATARMSVPDWTRQITASEERAIEIRAFGPLVVPGLLQTADYARELFRHGEPDANIDALVRARTQRLQALQTRGPDLSFVVTEAVLRAPVGGAETMAGQLEHLATADGVRVQVLPTGVGTSAWATGGFRLLSYADRGPSAYSESASGGMIVCDVNEVKRLAATWAELAAWSADPDRSREMILEIASAYR